MYAYTAVNNNADYSATRELAYWRKHSSLHGWMKQIWLNRCGTLHSDPDNLNTDFNGIELELSWEDLDMLENDIAQGALPETRGFFFGDAADDYYKEADLEFIKNARAELFVGLKVFYNSSW